MKLNLDNKSGVVFIWKKEGKECPFIELIGSKKKDDKLGVLVKKFKSYAIIERDLNLSKTYFERIQGMQADDNFREALLESAVISYSRPFATGSGKNVHLESRIFNQIPKFKETHEFLRNMRNKFYAHTDENDLETVMVYIALAPEPLSKGIVEIYRGLARTAGFEDHVYENSIGTINFALGHVGSKLDELYDLIMSIVKNEDLDHLYSIAINPDSIASSIHKYSQET